MIKKIKIYSVVALAALVIIGCGADDNNESTTKDFSTYSDAEKLAYAIANQRDTFAAGQGEQKTSKSRAFGVSCEKGGTVDVNFFDPSEYLLSGMTFKNCDDGYGVTNGTVKIDLDSNDDGTISFLTDFSVKGDDDIFIKKGGTVTMNHDGEWEVSTINMVAIYNGVTHGGENLVYRSKELPNGYYIEYPESGREKIGDSAYFDVDTSYNASKTPFTSNTNDELLSGHFKYLDANNNAVELEVTSKDIITVRVDENGDGVFSDDEKSIVNLAQ